MTKEILYKYLGTNGTIISPIHLENIYCVKIIRLIADKGYTITKDNKVFQYVVEVPEEEINLWTEVKDNLS